MRKNGYGRGGRRDTRSRGKTQTVLPRVRVLIVCEGKKTEPGYFELFTIHPTVREVKVIGTGMNTASLVKKTEEFEENDGPFDEIWCVFDRDSFNAGDYDNAIAKIRSKSKYNVAYSNEAFELWFVLHFEFLNARIGRAQYIEKLSDRLGVKYEKNNPSLYRHIQEIGNEEQAMKWAERLLSEHMETSSLAEQCPSTTVHHLVKKLREWEQESKFPRA
jgi:hypothetical protein